MWRGTAMVDMVWRLCIWLNWPWCHLLRTSVSRQSSQPVSHQQPINNRSKSDRSYFPAKTHHIEHKRRTVPQMSAWPVDMWYMSCFFLCRALEPISFCGATFTLIRLTPAVRCFVFHYLHPTIPGSVEERELWHTHPEGPTRFWYAKITEAAATGAFSTSTPGIATPSGKTGFGLS